MPENTPFYTNTDNNTSLPVDLTRERGAEIVKRSVLVGRKTEFSDIFISSTSGFGFPGIPFVSGEPNPSVFCQGEDVIFDAFLYHEGKPVITEKYNIFVYIKPSTRSTKIIWEGTINDGIYPQDREGYYTVWMPSELTSAIYAGSYSISVHLAEPVAEGSGPHDRKISLINTMFNIEYCGDSPNPENIGKQEKLPRRGSLGRTWPNGPDTVHG